jgi:hypothetical protein
MSASSFELPDKRSPNATGRAALDVVIAYDGIAAALKALDTLASLHLPESAGAVMLRASTWCFRFLEDMVQWNKATAAAAEADLLVIAAVNGVDLPRPVKTWLRTGLARNQRSGVTVVALLGDEDREENPKSGRFRFVQQTTRHSGARFIAPSSERSLRPENGKTLARAGRPGCS